jgi:hypothetical protein
MRNNVFDPGGIEHLCIHAAQINFAMSNNLKLILATAQQHPASKWPSPY